MNNLSFVGERNCAQQLTNDLRYLILTEWSPLRYALVDFLKQLMSLAQLSHHVEVVLVFSHLMHS